MNIKRYIDMMVKKSVRRAIRDADFSVLSSAMFKLTDYIHDVASDMDWEALHDLASDYNYTLRRNTGNKAAFLKHLNTLKYELWKRFGTKNKTLMQDFSGLIGRVYDEYMRYINSK